MDRISNLPNDVLQHILSFLPTKHAVATSILSTRWIRLWDSLQVLDFDDSVYLFPERKSVASGNLFLKFVDKVLSANKSRTIFKFTLRVRYLSEKHLSRINGWIKNVVLRNVVEIDLTVFLQKDDKEVLDLTDSLDYTDDEEVLDLTDSLDYTYDEEVLWIPGCTSLEIVKVDSAHALYMPTSGCCFPNLRVLDVKMPMDETDNELTRELILSLPRLEELFLCGNLTDGHGDININLTGTALKVLDFELRNHFYNDCDAEVMIDAPNLQVLRIKDMDLSSYLVKNKPRLNEIKIDIGDYSDDYIEYIEDVSDSHVDRLRKLLQGIDNAESLSISATTPLTLIFAHDTTLPVFHYLTKLELMVYPCTWVLLLHWLQSSPNLKHLSLIIEENMEDLHLQEVVDWSLSESVPPCLSLSITEIEIKRVGTIEEEELLMYLLNNAKVLDKFIVNSHVYIKDGVLQ